MKRMRLLLLALLLPAFVMVGCDKGGDDGDKQIELPNQTEKNQQAFADDETTGGFTFTAKAPWTATVTEGGATRAGNVSWLRLLYEGEEKYSGEAGTFTLVIEIDENYTGATRTATITVTSGTDKITVTVTQDGKTEDGEKPVDPTIGMKYVSSITYTSGTEVLTSDFEYDTKNRVKKMTQSNGSILTLDWDNADNILRIDDEVTENLYVLNLNASGAIVSGKAYESETPFTATYKNGYLDKFNFDSDEVFTMTWSGGNMTATKHEQTDFSPVTNTLTYNSSWANNPKCNLDLNGLIFTFDDGIFDGVAELLGLFGTRSKHMVSGYSVSGGNHNGQSTTAVVEYDTEGFVKKITTESGSSIYTITYR